MSSKKYFQFMVQWKKQKAKKQSIFKAKKQKSKKAKSKKQSKFKAKSKDILQNR